MEKEQVFVVIWEDRHTDVGVRVYRDKEEAINRARLDAHRMASRGGEDGMVEETLTEEMRSDGWLYRGVYGPEGDGLRVMEREVE
jgi:hypothetical protein